jgi:hypothetical protein
MQASSEIENIRSCLLYLHGSELKEICKQLTFSPKGVKIALVQQIAHFLQTGQELKAAQYLAISKAKNGKIGVGSRSSYAQRSLQK